MFFLFDIIPQLNNYTNMTTNLMPQIQRIATKLNISREALYSQLERDKELNKLIQDEVQEFERKFINIYKEKSKNRKVGRPKKVVNKALVDSVTSRMVQYT